MPAFTDAIAGIENEIAALTERRARLLAAEPTLRALDALNLNSTIFIFDRVEYTILLFHQPGFTAADNPALLDLLERIEQIIGPAEYTVEDDARNDTRLYTITASDLSVRIRVYLAPDAPGCQSQIVGYEEATEDRLVTLRVTRPIYRFVC